VLGSSSVFSLVLTKGTWSRQKGSWWGARKRTFAAGRGELAWEAKKIARRISRRVIRWRAVQENKVLTAVRAKRSCDMAVVEISDDTTS
jgi:hypothetical protein